MERELIVEECKFKLLFYLIYVLVYRNSIIRTNLRRKTYQMVDLCSLWNQQRSCLLQTTTTLNETSISKKLTQDNHVSLELHMNTTERLLILSQGLKFSIIVLIRLILVITYQRLLKIRREFLLLVKARPSNSFFGKKNARKQKKLQAHVHMKTIKLLLK